MKEIIQKHMYSIAPDILTKEKVEEIISHGCEDDTVDFKSTVDTSSNKFKLDLTCDIASFANKDGGYILIGFDDKSKKIVHCDDSLVKTFDPANIHRIINEYYSSEILIESKSFEIDGKKIICIFVKKSKNVIIFKKNGGFKDGDKDSFKFKNGEIYVRENTSNERANKDDLERIITEKALSIVQNSPFKPDHGVDINKICPLNSDQGVFKKVKELEETFENEVNKNVSPQDYEININLFLNSFLNIISEEIKKENFPIFKRLVQRFLKFGTDFYNSRATIKEANLDGILFLEKFIYTVYAIGVLLLKEQLINWIPCLVKQQYFKPNIQDQSMGEHKEYEHYHIRKLITSLHRSKRIKKNIINQAYEELKDFSYFKNIPQDQLLNLFVSFDYMYCLIAFLQEKGSAEVYPSFANFNKTRYEKELISLIKDNKLEEIFPELSKEKVKQIILELDAESTKIEKYNHWYSGGWSEDFTQKFFEKIK